MTSDDSPIHLLMRISDAIMSVDDTITEHQAVIKKRNAVWIGKIGKTLGNGHIERVNQQCQDGTKTYLFLAQNRGAPRQVKYEVHRGTVMEVTRKLPENQHRLDFPMNSGRSEKSVSSS